MNNTAPIQTTPCNGRYCDMGFLDDDLFTSLNTPMESSNISREIRTVTLSREVIIFLIIYASFYIMCMIIMSIISSYMHSRNYFRSLWLHKNLYFQQLLHIFDSTTNIAVLILWGLMITDDIDYTSLDSQMFAGTMHHFIFYVSLSVLVASRICACLSTALSFRFRSLFDDEADQADDEEAKCQQLWNKIPLRILWQSIENYDEKSIIQQQSLYFVHILVESFPEAVLQSVFLMRSYNDDSLQENQDIVFIIYLSLTASISNITMKYLWVDARLMVDKVMDSKWALFFSFPWYAMVSIWRISGIITRIIVFSLSWSVIGFGWTFMGMIATVLYWMCIAPLFVFSREDEEIGYDTYVPQGIKCFFMTGIYPLITSIAMNVFVNMVIYWDMYIPLIINWLFILYPIGGNDHKWKPIIFKRWGRARNIGAVFLRDENEGEAAENPYISNALMAGFVLTGVHLTGLLILKCNPFIQEDIQNIRKKRKSLCAKKEKEGDENEEGAELSGSVKQLDGYPAGQNALEEQLELVTITDGDKQRSITEVLDDEETDIMAYAASAENENDDIKDRVKNYDIKSAAIQDGMKQIKSLIRQISDHEMNMEDNDEQGIASVNEDVQPTLDIVDKMRIYDERLNAIEEDMNEIKLMLLQYMKQEHKEFEEERLNIDINDELNRMKSTEL